MRKLLTVVTILLSPTAIFAQQPFAFQGFLDHEALPAQGAFDFLFELYDSEVGGSTVGKNDAQTLFVEQGHFDVTLDFGTVFDGSEVWLQMGVRPKGVGDYETVGDRVPISPVPFAYHSFNTSLSLPFSGAVSHVGPAFEILNSGPALAVGVEGLISSSTNGSAGVYGLAGAASTLGTGFGPTGVVGSSQTGYGVAGVSDSNNGVVGMSESGNGVYGASSIGGSANGVVGHSQGSGYAVMATSIGAGDAFYALATGAGKEAVIDGILDVGSTSNDGHLSVFDGKYAGLVVGPSEKYEAYGSGLSIRDDEGETVVHAGVMPYSEGGFVHVVADGDAFFSNYGMLAGNYADSGSPGLFLTGAGSTISLRSQYSGNEAVNFPPNAIGQLEIEDEPGVANALFNGGPAVTLERDPTVIVSHTINAPVAGYVLAIGTVDMWIFDTQDAECGFGISQTAESIPREHWFQIQYSVDGLVGSPITVHMLFQVDAGASTFYFLGEWGGLLGDSPCRAGKTEFTLVFLPTSYGTVEMSTLADEGPSPREEPVSAPRPVDPSAEKENSSRANELRIQRELDEMQRQIQELRREITGTR